MTIARITATRNSADIISCEATMQVRDVVKLLATKRIGAVPILENGSVVGIFSERDVIYRLADEGEVCLNRPVSDVMTAPAITVDETTRIDDALALMTRRRIRHLPVLDKGALKAFISIGDLVKSKMDEVAHEAEAMRSYIQTA
ncbi:CBS domain-containing protein [Altererythrobacter sp. GH1-8]|uniref:CBS domain-containing protein n=1 Tax=Altererythrobacter sp. GH1-8 TaxID=3349333 RepID=UPI00374DDB49